MNSDERASAIRALLLLRELRRRREANPSVAERQVVNRALLDEVFGQEGSEVYDVAVE